MMDLICKSCGAKNNLLDNFNFENSNCDFCGSTLAENISSSNSNKLIFNLQNFVDDSIQKITTSEITIEEKIEAYFILYDKIIQHKDFKSIGLSSAIFFEILLADINSETFIPNIKRFFEYFQNEKFVFTGIRFDIMDYNSPFDILFKVEEIFHDSIYGKTENEYVDKISLGFNDKKNGVIFKKNLTDLYKIIGSLNTNNSSCSSLILGLNKSLINLHFGRYYQLSNLRKISDNIVSGDVFLLHYLNKLYVFNELSNNILNFYTFKIDDDYIKYKGIDKIHLIENDYNSLIIYYKNNILTKITDDSSLLKNFERLNSKFNKLFNPSEEKKKSSGYCFIATAAMSSYDHPVVIDLRIFRDNWLLKRNWGIAFTKWYYIYGAKAAKHIEGSILLKKLAYILIVKPLHFFVKKRILKNK